MDKQGILKQLKEVTEIKRLKFPERINLTSENGILCVEMTEGGLLANMQENQSAFEAWIIAIKATCPELVHKAVIRWSHPEKANLHYVRFLYRVIKFEESYDWVSIAPIDSNAKGYLENIRRELSQWVINYPDSDAKIDAEKTEAQLERALLNNLKSDLGTESGNQLPIGLFFKKKSGKKEYERTPRRNSQLDLWSIRNNTFTVYELKKEENTPLGIISELMFYVNVIKDISLGTIRYPNDAVEGKDFRNFGVVFDKLPHNKKMKIEGVFLANTLHSLFHYKQAEILEILNDNHRGISYEHAGFDSITKRIIN